MTAAASYPHVITHHVINYRQPVTVSLKGQTTEGLRAQAAGLLAVHGFSATDNNGVLWIDKAGPVPDEYVVYRPKHRPVSYLAEVIKPLLETARNESRPPVDLEQIDKKPKQEYRREDPALVITEADQIAFMAKADKAPNLRRLLEEIDQPTGEVLLKAAVYEVATTKQDGSAVRLALSLSGLSAGVGGLVNGPYINLKAGGLEVLLSALDSDSRFKSLARPQVRVKNGAQARFSVGQDVPVLGAQQLDRNGNAVQSVEYKSSGIILTTKPENLS